MTDDFKKKLKEIADKVSDSQSAQSIATTQTPKISTSISTNTKTTNKSGRMKSAPIKKEPKREKLTWSDEDSRDGWNDRLFLEGFYEVDGTVNDWEREKRMSQVERSLKEIEKRKRKSEKPPAVRAPFGRNLTGQSGTFTRLPGTPNAPVQITKLPYYGGRYPAYTNYANVTNKNAAASKSGDTTRPPTKEEMQAAYADMQNRFSGRYTGQHLNDATEYVTNAATPQNNTQRKTRTATTTSTAQTQSRDARVRENYRARQQAEADARYEDFDIEAAEAKLRDNAKGVGKLAYDVTSSIANMAPSVALGTLNPALGSAAMFGSVYGNSYNSALHEGKDRGEAQTYATLRAVSETALQNILGGTSALGGKMPEALVGSIKNINNAAYRIAAKYGKSILSEGSEEYLQKILQPVIRNLAFGEDNKFRVISEDAAYAGLMGALTAGVFETGNIVRGENWDNTPPPVTINKNPIIQDILKTENNVGELAKPYPKENLPKEVVEWIRKLPQYKDAIEISSTPSYEQISLLSRQEGVEFASITIGNRNIIIRGDTSGTPISQDLLEDMIRNKGVLNCHSHPYIGDFRPSESDLYIAHILSHQEEFEIITPDNMRAVYTKHGIKSVGNIERKLSEQDVLELYKLFGG